jgi:hypothetical protein
LCLTGTPNIRAKLSENVYHMVSTDCSMEQKYGDYRRNGRRLMKFKGDFVRKF